MPDEFALSHSAYPTIWKVLEIADGHFANRACHLCATESILIALSGHLLRGMPDPRNPDVEA
jgi:hypothetical protein